MACGDDAEDNIVRAENFARQAAKENADVILLPELFERPYFCKTQRAEFLEWAKPASDNPMLGRMQNLARELKAAMPVSFFERAGSVYFNSLAMINADGNILGVYRKSHIPDGPGYQEKFYFSPGDSGFQVWQAADAKIGAAICWDQWFPEAARCLALKGAEVVFYPTAIGSEPHLPNYDSSKHWQNVMRGHAAANMVPVVAANRIGQEVAKDVNGNEITVAFYGRSFIAGADGEIIADAGRDETIITASFNLDEIADARAQWGVFRDRRPELYRPILSLDGIIKQ